MHCFVKKLANREYGIFYKYSYTKGCMPHERDKLYYKDLPLINEKYDTRREANKAMCHHIEVHNWMKEIILGG